MPMIVACNTSFLFAEKSYLLLTGLFFLHGVLVGVNFTSVNVIYRGLLPDDPDERQVIKSKFSSLLNLSAGLSGIVVTQLMGQFGWNIPDLLFGLLATTMVYRVQVPKIKPIREDRVRSPLSLRWRLATIGLPILIVSLISRVYFIYFPVISGTMSGILLLAYYIANGFTADWITRIAIRYSRKKVIHGSMLIIGFDCILLSQVTDFLLLLLISVVSGLAARGILICLYTEMEVYAESRFKETAAVVSSSFQTMTNVGQLVGGFIAGYFLVNPNLWFLVVPLIGFILVGEKKLN
jgi:MFS family permease